MRTRTKYSEKIKRMTIIGLFVALAYAVSAVLPIKVSFLTLDFKDVISTICGMFFGPVTGIACAIIVPFMEFITTSETGVYGLIMNLLSSVSFVAISTLVYKNRKTIGGAILGLGTALSTTLAVMLLANLFITPYYMGVTQEAVIALIPKLIFPFNLIKLILNSGLIMLIYKPVSRVLKKMGLSKSVVSANVSKSDDKAKNRTRSLIVTLASTVIVILAIIVVFNVLGGEFQFGWTKA